MKLQRKKYVGLCLVLTISALLPTSLWAQSRAPEDRRGWRHENCPYDYDSCPYNYEGRRACPAAGGRGCFYEYPGHRRHDMRSYHRYADGRPAPRARLPRHMGMWDCPYIPDERQPAPVQVNAPVPPNPRDAAPPPPPVPPNPEA